MAGEQVNVIALEECEGLLFACQAGLETSLRDIWDCAQRKRPLDKTHRIRIGLACVTAVRQGAEIVRKVYDLAGASAILRAGVQAEV